MFPLTITSSRHLVAHRMFSLIISAYGTVHILDDRTRFGSVNNVLQIRQLLIPCAYMLAEIPENLHCYRASVLNVFTGTGNLWEISANWLAETRGCLSTFKHVTIVCIILCVLTIIATSRMMFFKLKTKSWEHLNWLVVENISRCLICFRVLYHDFWQWIWCIKHAREILIGRHFDCFCFFFFSYYFHKISLEISCKCSLIFWEKPTGFDISCKS